MYALTQKKKTLSTDDDASRSKKVITLMNRLGLSMSYDEMMRIDTRLTERVIQEAGKFKVTVGRSIEPGIILHGAIVLNMMKRLCQEKTAAMTQF